jgi:hypothetical protein
MTFAVFSLCREVANESEDESPNAISGTEASQLFDRALRDIVIRFRDVKSGITDGNECLPNNRLLNWRLN